MDGAFSAGALPLTEFATVQSHVCIFKELLAVVAELFVSLLLSAIDVYHVRHGLFLSFYACHAVRRSVLS